MIYVTALVQLKAFARQDGVILALTWIASFILMIYTPQYSYGNLLALSTPFIVGWRLCAFRNYALDGKISFRRGFAYSCYTFFYASLVFALCQYAYIKFIDGDSIKNMLAETVKVLTPVYQEQGLSLNEINSAASMMASLRPIDLSIIFMMQNLFIGLLLSLPLALIFKRSAAPIK